MNKNIEKYKVILGNSKEDLERQIEEVILNRYFELFGGVSIAYGEGGTLMFAQAIVARRPG